MIIICKLSNYLVLNYVVMQRIFCSCYN